jgi:hypothetical protein
MPASLIKNTLLSSLSVERLRSLPKKEEALAVIKSTVNQFQQMKAFASEMQTEANLVKPLFRVLGFAFESKPKFFEEHVKGADFALFRSEADRMASASKWGTAAYYQHVLSLLSVKRYGRNLGEGISGFYLEFENRIPIYQSLYLMKTARTPWTILTNGKTWLLLKRPLANEKLIIEMDLEKAVNENDEESLHLFCHIFSSEGLSNMLPALISRERDDLIALLKDKRSSLSQSFSPSMGKEECHKVARRVYADLFPQSGSPVPGQIQQSTGRRVDKPAPVKAFDQSDIFAYLLTRGAGGEGVDLERVLLDSLGEDRTKEHLLSFRVLDMTPGFGNLAAQLTETIAYLSFLLPYREKHSFVVEWENDLLLHRFIIDHMLHGICRSPFALDVLRSALSSRFDCSGKNYRQGNPLLGMSVKDLNLLADGKSQTGLFSKHPREVTTELKEMLHLYFSLSDRIKEDAAMKGEMETTIHLWTYRMKEIMDLLTASYFDDSLESKKIKELLYYMDGDEALWEKARAAEWFRGAMDLAQRKSFFHMEIEFPFLLNERFDMIFVQPNLTFFWEEQVPEAEAVKAYVKRAMAFLTPLGSLLLAGRYSDELLSDLKKSRRYTVEPQEGAVLVRRRQ